jgi:DNA repair protein RadC
MMSGEEDHSSDAELLRKLLGGRRQGWEELLDRAQGLRGLEGLAASELLSRAGIGPRRADRLLACFEIARRMPTRRRQDRARIASSRDVFELVHLDLRRLDREVFEVLELDARHALRQRRRISVGTLMGTLVQPREVFRGAIREGAASIVAVHNHPSGDPTPSVEDVEVTHRLAAAGEILGIPLLDHIVVGDGCYISLADRGVLGRSAALRGQAVAGSAEEE